MGEVSRCMRQINRLSALCPHLCLTAEHGDDDVCLWWWQASRSREPFDETVKFTSRQLVGDTYQDDNPKFHNACGDGFTCCPAFVPMS